jgi:hypothetical protein
MRVLRIALSAESARRDFVSEGWLAKARSAYESLGVV